MIMRKICLILYANQPSKNNSYLYPTKTATQIPHTYSHTQKSTLNCILLQSYNSSSMIQQQIESPSLPTSAKKPNNISEELEPTPSQTSSKNNAESNIYYTKNKKIIYWLYILVCLTFVVSQATLVSENWKNYESFTLTDGFYLANQVVTQWRKGFVTGVKIIGSGTDCPQGYQPAFNFTWPGTSFGCFCQVDVNSSFVIEGYCSPKLIQSSCRNIQSQSPIFSTNWKNSSKICIRRSPTTSFHTEERYNGGNKICGSSKSLIIMPNDQPCPFVNTTFSIPDLEDHYSLISDSGSLLDNFYATFNATSPYSFYSYPVSKFTVSQYQFCLIDQDSGLTPDRTEFVLLNQKRGCADPGAYQTLDSITQIEFYANNPKLNTLSSINGFPKPSNSIYNLGFASLPSWTYNCRHNYDKKFSIAKALPIINFQFFTSYYYTALVQILLYSVLGFQIFILVVRRLLKKQVFPVGYRQMYLPEDFCYALSRYLIDFITKFTVLGLLIYTSWVVFVNWNWFKSALNLNCPDDNPLLITRVMQPYRTMYEQSLKYVVAQLVIFFFVAIIDLVHFVYIYRNQLKYYLVDSYGKVMVEHEVKDELEWIDKDNTDKKLLNIQGMEKEGLDGGIIGGIDDDKFRITMAVINGLDKGEENAGRGKIVKKKKKKLFGAKKDYQNLEVKNDDEANLFGADDPSILGLNSIDNLSGERKQDEKDQENKGRKSGLDRKRRRK